MKNVLYKQSWPYIVVTIVFFLLSFLFFGWQLWDSFSIQKPIDHTIWGQFGDFVGGTLGVIFSLVSVILVVLTFKSQQRNAAEQRFNDMFFGTLQMFHEQEEELQFEFTEEDEEGVTYRGTDNYKDFFDRVKKEMILKFSPKQSFNHNRKEAIKIYAEVCIPIGGKLSICYRSLFRLLDMLDHASISENVRLEYAKVLRAQFTENELVCLRYHIKFGDYRKFAFLVNKYNIMKHLPIFDLLEFNYWYANNNLQEIEKREIGNFFIIVSKKIKERKSCQILRCNEQLILDIQITDSKVKLLCTKRPLKIQTQDFLKGIYKFDNKSIENLLECVLKEIVVFSNFSCYNNYSELVFNSRIRESNTSTCIEASVENSKRKPLILSFKESGLTLDNVPLLH